MNSNHLHFCVYTLYLEVFAICKYFDMNCVTQEGFFVENLIAFFRGLYVSFIFNVIKSANNIFSSGGVYRRR